MAKRRRNGTAQADGHPDDPTVTMPKQPRDHEAPSEGGGGIAAQRSRHGKAIVADMRSQSAGDHVPWSIMKTLVWILIPAAIGTGIWLKATSGC